MGIKNTDLEEIAGSSKKYQDQNYNFGLEYPEDWSMRPVVSTPEFPIPGVVFTAGDNRGKLFILPHGELDFGLEDARQITEKRNSYRRKAG